VIVLPGGAYHHHADHEAGAVARWLNSFGLQAFVLRYRLEPHPAPLQDLQRAVRLVRHQAGCWRVNPDRVGVLGFSAGGHLAATLATHFDGGDPSAADPVERFGCRPDAVILGYAGICFGRFRHHGSFQRLLGDNPTEAQVRDVSCDELVGPDTPPAFLWHTAADASVPVNNSFCFAEALHRHGVPFELHVFPFGRHGLGLARELPEVARWTDLCRDWLLRLGF